MVGQPGPQQRFNSKIVKISFTGGGLIYLRATFDAAEGAGSASAIVSGLPWEPFDLFEVVGGFNDPKLKEDQTKRAPIQDPVTDDMIAQYLYWAHYHVVHETTTIKFPGTDKYVVDLANWSTTYNGRASGRFSPLWTRQHAVDFFKSHPEDGQDPALIDVDLLDNFGQVIGVPSDTFWLGVAQSGWTYHIEKTGGSSASSVHAVASVILNLSKLSRDVPIDKDTKKRPDKVKFSITGKSAVTGSAWVSGKPPKDPPDPLAEKRRRTFPVDAVPAGSNIEQDVPKFPHPDDNALDLAKAQITFGTAKAAPKIETAEDPGT